MQKIIRCIDHKEINNYQREDAEKRFHKINFKMDKKGFKGGYCILPIDGSEFGFLDNFKE